MLSIHEEVVQMKKKLSDMYKSFSEPIAVLGGAPSLQSDFEKITHEAITISVNEHGFVVCNPDICVFLNDPAKYKNLQICLDSDVMRVTKLLKYTDVEVNVKHFHGGFSGQFAVWLACYLTTNKVYICGMDLYGSKNHYYDINRKHERFDVLVRTELQDSLKHDWIRLKRYIDNDEQVFACSGILTSIFKHYEPS